MNTDAFIKSNRLKSLTIDAAVMDLLSTPLDWTPFFYLSIFIFILSYFIICTVQKKSTVPRVTPAGPLGILILQTLVKNLKNNRFYEWMKACLDHPGHTAEMKIFGTRFILTEEPDNIKAIFTSQFKSYGKGVISHKSLGHLAGNSIFTADGEEWRNKRKELRPYLASIKQSDIRITEFHVQRFLDTLESSTGPVDVYDAIDKLQLNVALHRFLGHKTVADVGMYEKFRKAKHIIGFAGTLRMFVGPIGDMVSWIISRKAKREIDGYLESLIESMANPGQDSALVLEESVDAERSSNIVESKPTRDLLLILLLAGKDPAVTAIAWTLYHLAQHPETVEKLHLEIKSSLGYNHPPTLQDLKHMVFLNNVIRESMRLHPPVGFNLREALADTTLPRGAADGYSAISVQKGDVIFVSILGMHRRSASFGPDADLWRPDRWDNWTPPEGEYVPFSFGPRVCLGQAFGQFQLEYTIVRILQRFASISYHGPEQLIKFEINTKPAFPTLCRFHLHFKTDLTY